MVAGLCIVRGAVPVFRQCVNASLGINVGLCFLLSIPVLLLRSLVCVGRVVVFLCVSSDVFSQLTYCQRAVVACYDGEDENGCLLLPCGC